jgi:hypothetical protein
LNDPFELPSLEQIEEMERQRLQAIESLEISGSSVKCQRYGTAAPIVGKLPGPHNDRVAILQKRIKWMENYYHVVNVNDLKELKQDLAELLEEDLFYPFFLFSKSSKLFRYLNHLLHVLARWRKGVTEYYMLYAHSIDLINVSSNLVNST